MKKIMKVFVFAVLAVSLSFATIATSVSASSKNNGPKVKLGIEVLMEEEIDLIKGKNVGLITNPTGVDNNMNSTVDLLYNHPDVNLVAMYGPEHGVRGDAQAGASIESYVDDATGLTVYSLYGKTQKATPEMLKGVDVLIFDIQDVGARFYTYIYTMYYAIEAASENNIEIIILDRPNPIGGLKVEGPAMEPGSTSFIGLIEDMPTRHGMTVAELALYFNEVKLPEKGIAPAKLNVVKMKGWERGMLYEDTGLHFVLPSPNMPTPETTQHYIGTALFERIHVAEGRGTTKPFELIGAKYINPKEYADAMNALNLPGVLFRAASFTPVSANQNITPAMTSPAHGVELFITDATAYDPIRTTLFMISKLNEMYPNPEKDGTGFYFTAGWDKLMGNKWVEDRILAGVSVDDIIAEWQPGLEAFKTVREGFLLYGTTVDKTALDSKILEAKEIDKTKYTEESVKALNEAIEAAETLTNNPNAVQAQIKPAVDALDKAILDLEPITVPETPLDYEALEKEIQRAKQAVEENYTPESYAELTLKIEAAEAILEKAKNDEATQEQIDKALTALTEAIEGLEAISTDGGTEEPGIDTDGETDKEDPSTGILNNSLQYGMIALTGLTLLTGLFLKSEEQ